MKIKTPGVIREKLKKSQMVMAVECGVSITTIKQFEDGTLLPSLRTARKLAAAYRMTIDDVNDACAQPAAK